MASTINSDTSNGLILTPDTTGEIELQSAGTTQAKITSSGLQNASGVAITAQSGKNLIINGDMAIDQRNAGASVTFVNGQYGVDRWKGYLTQASKYTVQQNAGAITPPAGFNYYLGATSSSAYTTLAADYFSISQPIEGLNSAHLNWGTANAKTVTLSFWTRSSLTGTFGGAVGNNNGTRGYPFTYTISVADTWEYKTVTISGDTTGTWLETNGLGIIIYWSLGTGTTYSGTGGAWAGSYYASATGATSVVGTSGATLYITGVQLEANTTATDFENLQYGTQLALCQRYYERIVNTVAQSLLGDTYANTAGSPVPTINVSFKQTKRAAATMATVGTFTTSNTSGTQQLFSGENTMSAFYLTAAVGRAYFFPTANSGWSAASEL